MVSRKWAEYHWVNTGWPEKSEVDVSTNFYNQLASGPSVLFLGQRYFQAFGEFDPVLAEISRKFASEAQNLDNYDNLYFHGTDESAVESFAWLTDRCRRFAPPTALELIAQFSWSGVYSSAIDPIWLPSFGTPEMIEMRMPDQYVVGPFHLSNFQADRRCRWVPVDVGVKEDHGVIDG